MYHLCEAWHFYEVQGQPLSPSWFSWLRLLRKTALKWGPPSRTLWIESTSGWLLTIATAIKASYSSAVEILPGLWASCEEVSALANSKTEILKHWNTEKLKYCNTEKLKYWNTARVVSKAAHVRKFLLLPTDFSLAGGELTPTLKVVLAQVSPSEVEAKS